MAPVQRAIAGGRELPLIGIDLIDTGGFRFEARLTDASLAAYRSEAARLGQSLQTLRRTGLQASPDAAAQVTGAFAQLDQIRRIHAVMGAFLPPASPQVGPEDATLRQWALRHLPALDSAAQIARRIKAELGRTKIDEVRIVAPVRADSAEVTGLSGSIGDALRAELGSTPDRPVRYTLDGRYEPVDKKILLTLYLMDASFSTERAFAYLLPGNAEKAFRSPPSAGRFSGTLSRGLVRIESLGENAGPSARPPQAPAGSLVVEVQTGRGNRALYYRVGERDRLLVKLDKPGYYYIVGHVEKENKRLSYLMEIGAQAAGNRFVRRVGAGETNRWQTVGEFTVEAPLGVEAVQVFAASEPPDRMLPRARFDPARQLYVIGDNPVDAIEHARGLVRIEMAGAAGAAGTKQPAVGEAVLQFTTLQ